jgi:ATP-dependent DNA ligase
MAKRSGRRVRLFTRNGKDWSELFPAVVTAVQQLDISSCLIDGEIVVCDEHGLGRCRATIKVRGHIASSSNAPHRWTVAATVMFPLPHGVDAKMIDRRGPFFCSTRAASILPSRPA